MAQMQHEATLLMESAHRPRPFGCCLRVTVGSVRTRTVLDLVSVVLSRVAAGEETKIPAPSGGRLGWGLDL